MFHTSKNRIKEDVAPFYQCSGEDDVMSFIWKHEHFTFHGSLNIHAGHYGNPSHKIITI